MAQQRESLIHHGGLTLISSCRTSSWSDPGSVWTEDNPWCLPTFTYLLIWGQWSTGQNCQWISLMPSSPGQTTGPWAAAKKEEPSKMTCVLASSSPQRLDNVQSIHPRWEPRYFHPGDFYFYRDTGAFLTLESAGRPYFRPGIIPNACSKPSMGRATKVHLSWQSSIACDFLNSCVYKNSKGPYDFSINMCLGQWCQGS